MASRKKARKSNINPSIPELDLHCQIVNDRLAIVMTAGPTRMTLETDKNGAKQVLTTAARYFLGAVS